MPSVSIHVRVPDTVAAVLDEYASSAATDRSAVVREALDVWIMLVARMQSMVAARLAALDLSRESTHDPKHP